MPDYEHSVESGADSIEELLPGDSSLDDGSVPGMITVHIETETERMAANDNYPITSSAEESTSNLLKEEDGQPSAMEESTENADSEEISGIIVLRRHTLANSILLLFPALIRTLMFHTISHSLISARCLPVILLSTYCKSQCSAKLG